MSRIRKFMEVTGLQNAIGRVLDKAEFEAFIWGCVYIANVDGGVSAAESARIIRNAKAIRWLSPWSAAEIRKAFDRANEVYVLSPPVGKATAIGQIRRIKDPGRAMMLFCAFCDVASADGAIDNTELATLLTISAGLGLPTDEITPVLIGLTEGVVRGQDGPQPKKAAAEIGRKGGKARAEKMSPERRVEIAKAAAEKRWGQRREDSEGGA